MIIQQIMVVWAHVWAWHENPGERQPATPSQPPPATKPHSQADSTRLLAHGHRDLTNMEPCTLWVISSQVNARDMPSVNHRSELAEQQPCA